MISATRNEEKVGQQTAFPERTGTKQKTFKEGPTPLNEGKYKRIKRQRHIFGVHNEATVFQKRSKKKGTN